MHRYLLAAYAAAASIGLPVSMPVSPQVPAVSAVADYRYTCYAIEGALSPLSSVFYPGNTDYVIDIAHWLPTSTQSATCSVRPYDTDEVVKIMKILAKTKTPFAIKGGGHSFNQGFSSTVGVQIALGRINDVIVGQDRRSVTLGMGGIWSSVYTILQAQNLTVSGGRIHGVGVGGYLLGGGFSYLSSESGLSMDNVISYEIVLPNATVTTASKTRNPDLFWGLKGGGNNFGVVTKAVVNAFPLERVYGGELVYEGDALKQLPAAMEAYEAMQNSANSADKGNLMLAYNIIPGEPTQARLQIFYNGIDPPARFLAPFAGIKTVASTLDIRSLTELISVTSAMFDNSANRRSAATTVSINNMTAPVISDFVKITENTTKNFPGAYSAGIIFEPFTPKTIVSPGCDDGVFPHAVYSSPLLVSIWWKDPARDAAGAQAIDKLADDLQDVLRAQKQPVDSMVLYPNYAAAGHGIKEVFGDCLPRAKALRAKIDPEGLMLRTGGWKFV